MKTGSKLSRTERVWVARMLTGPTVNNYPNCLPVKRLVGRGLAVRGRTVKTGAPNLALTPEGVIAAGGMGSGR